MSDALVFLELRFLQGVCCLETLVSGEPELLVFDVQATLLVGSGDFRHSVVWRFGWVAVSSINRQELSLTMPMVMNTLEHQMQQIHVLRIPQ